MFSPNSPILTLATILVLSDDDDQLALNICGAGDTTVEMEVEFDDRLLCVRVSLFSALFPALVRLLSQVGILMNGLEGDEERGDISLEACP